MLPFQDKRHEGSTSGEDEEPSQMREEDFGMIDAIAEDLMEAFHSRNKKLLKSALEAFVEHIKSEDEKQDESMNDEMGAPI